MLIRRRDVLLALTPLLAGPLSHAATGVAILEPKTRLRRPGPEGAGAGAFFEGVTGRSLSAALAARRAGEAPTAPAAGFC